MVGSRDVTEVPMPIAVVYERSTILDIGYFRRFDGSVNFNETILHTNSQRY
jgi:hypothetical protein